MAEVDEENPFLADPPTDFEPVESIDEATAEHQVTQLRAAIREHDRRYYVAHDPIIADRTYDALFDRLQDLEVAFDLEEPNSPTKRVGGEPLDEFETVEHVAPMLSIDGSGEVADVLEFDQRVRNGLRETVLAYGDGGIRYVCEPKFDGVSMEFVYEDGELVRAVTRGDGREGDDVTRNARTIGSVPGQLLGEPPEFLAVRGEVYMPLDGFHAHNRERAERGEDPFANPRNATAGTIRQLDPSVVAERPLEVFYFDVLDASDLADTHAEELDRLPGYGLRTNELVEVVESIDDAIDYRDRLLERRDDLPYETDGVVIKVDDRSVREALGRTARHDRWAFAYKFPARSEVTRIADITVQVGRTGRLTPVALLDPVDVGGVTVSRASLHNPDEVAAKNVNVGDTVRVQRAGDVIPYVEAVVDKGSTGHYELPDVCPVCESAVRRDGPMAFCSGGLACDAQLRRSIEYYASDDGLDIEGLGEKSVRQLLEADVIASVADLYTLDRSDLVGLERWGQTSANNLLEEIQASRNPPLSDFLSAIGIPHVGPATARELAREFGTFERVREMAEAQPDELERVDDVGETVARTIHQFFESEANAAAVDAILEHVSPQRAADTGGNELDGLTIVFTGTLETMSRSDAQELVEHHGGSATSSVSGNTDYLVAGENPGARKRDDADDNDVSIIDEEDFHSLLDRRGVT